MARYGGSVLRSSPIAIGKILRHRIVKKTTTNDSSKVLGGAIATRPSLGASQIDSPPWTALASNAPVVLSKEFATLLAAAAIELMPV